MGTQQRSEGREKVFSARMESVGHFALLLKTITFCEKVNVFICETGLKFTVEEGKFVQASVYMPKVMFQNFFMAEETETISFLIPFKRFLECLKIFCNDGKGSESFGDISSSNATLSLSYEGYGSPFQIILEENGIRTDFKLKTEDVDDLVEFELDPIICKIVLKTEPLKDILTEIESNSPDAVEIIVEQNQQLRLKNHGIADVMSVSIPRNCEAIESFECSQSIKAHYKMSVLKHTFKSLHLGQKVALKMDKDGLLCLSFLMSNKIESFIEFFTFPQVLEEFEELTMF